MWVEADKHVTISEKFLKGLGSSRSHHETGFSFYQYCMDNTTRRKTSTIARNWKYNPPNSRTNFFWKNNKLPPQDKKAEWVKNLSDRELPEVKKRVLSKRPNFVATTSQISVVEFVTEREPATKTNNLTNITSEKKMSSDVSAKLAQHHYPTSRTIHSGLEHSPWPHNVFNL